MPATRLATRICGLMPSPSLPNRSPILSTPAARITGVASRKANLAASIRGMPRNIPATIVTPSLLMPASSASICAEPMISACQKLSPARRPSAATASVISCCRDELLVRLARLARPEALAEVQDHAVDDQEDRGAARHAEEHPEGVLEN